MNRALSNKRFLVTVVVLITLILGSSLFFVSRNETTDQPVSSNRTLCSDEVALTLFVGQSASYSCPAYSGSWLEVRLSSSNLIRVTVQLPTMNASSSANFVSSGSSFQVHLPIFSSGTVSLAIRNLENSTGPTSTSTGITSTTLSDASQNWVPDQWMGNTVKILTGNGAGQSRLVTSNSGNSLAVSPPWSPNPNSGAGYTIFAQSPNSVSGALGVFDQTAGSATVVFRGYPYRSLGIGIAAAAVLFLVILVFEFDRWIMNRAGLLRRFLRK